MKLARLFALCFLSASLVLFSGCMSKTYFFDFTTEPDLSRADGTWETGSPEYIIDENGLVLKNNDATGPHYYNGDFEVTWKFELDQDLTHNRTIYLFLASETGFPPSPGTEWFGGLSITDDQYPEGDFHFYFVCNGTTTAIPLLGPVSDILNCPGLNTLVIRKNGNILRFIMNDEEIGPEFNITDYYKDWFCPQVVTYYDQLAPWDTIEYKSFEVKYKGEQIPID